MSNVEERIEHIEKHPEEHRHTFAQLQACCITDGAIDCRIMDAHSQEAPTGVNGGVNCDVIEGPCNCGAIHRKE